MQVYSGRWRRFCKRQYGMCRGRPAYALYTACSGRAWPLFAGACAACPQRFQSAHHTPSRVAFRHYSGTGILWSPVETDCFSLRVQTPWRAGGLRRDPRAAARSQGCAARCASCCPGRAPSPNKALPLALVVTAGRGSMQCFAIHFIPFKNLNRRVHRRGRRINKIYWELFVL